MLRTSFARIAAAPRSHLPPARAIRPPSCSPFSSRAPPRPRPCGTVRPYSTDSNAERRWSTLQVGAVLVGLGALYVGYTSFRSVRAYTRHAKHEPAQDEHGVRTPPKEDVQKAIADLRAAGLELATEPSTLVLHGASENSYHPASPHSVVVLAHSTDDVVKVMKVSQKWRVPVVPYSGATSLEGHFSGLKTGSICVDLSGMDKILRVNEADADLTCQSGIQWETLNATLKERGIPLFFPLDPGPGATIGGMIGTGCSGTNAVRYGTARAEWFLNVTVVLPSGEVIKTRNRSRKSSAGFDLTKLFIGAEGTLGIVTEATLRLAPVLPTRVAMAQFPDVERAVDAVQEILGSPYGPHIQCVELLDNNMMKALNEGGIVERTYPTKDTLFFKLQGAAEAINLTADTVQAIVRRHASSHFEFASTDEEANSLWESRKEALWSSMAAAGAEYRAWTTDVCVPVSNLPRLVKETKQDLLSTGLKYTILGHVGDGNFHAILMFKDNKELHTVSEAVHRLVHRALRLEGTCTGEHGIGVGKKRYMIDELGEGTVNLMRTIKKAVDPLNLMNPGKLYPDIDAKREGEKRRGSTGH